MDLEETLEKLNKFPHIQTKLRQIWGDDQLIINFIETLMHDTRDGSRYGFEQDAVDTLLRVLSHHDKREFKDLKEYYVFVDRQ